MDFLVNLNCPQYVCFEKEMARNDDSLRDLANSSKCSSIEGNASENMDVDDANEISQCAEGDQSISGSMQSSLTESYITNHSYGENSWSATLKSGLKPEDFPVNCPKNLSLPSQNSKKYSKTNKTTKTQPFHLTEGKKRKREDEHVPLAEQVAAFQNKTPQRFHSAGVKNFQPMKHWSPEIIIPKSPKLQAAKRSRKVDAISREELEKKEIEEMKRYKFRARPLNPRILQRPEGGRKAGRRVATRPQEPHLHTAQRAAENYGKHKEEEKPFEFHARPIPKAMLNGPTGLKEKPALPITEAKTPNFALKTRAEKWKHVHKMNETVVETFKAGPAPTASQPFALKHEMKRTEIQPFSFDKRDKQRMKQKEQKIKEEIEKENAVYVFKAQPMPSPALSALPDVPKKPITQVKPFNLHADLKNSRHSSFNSSMGELCPSFKAHPPTVLKRPPFVPEKLPKPAVEIKEFQLHTDVRASERQKLKEINDIKEHEKELALQRMKALQEEEERKEILRLRKEAVHKANPIRHYKAVEIKPSSKAPTEPISPKFKTDERLQLKH